MKWSWQTPLVLRKGSFGTTIVPLKFQNQIVEQAASFPVVQKSYQGMGTSPMPGELPASARQALWLRTLSGTPAAEIRPYHHSMKSSYCYHAIHKRKQYFTFNLHLHH